MKKVLIYGIGNPGRSDDRLGILLVEKLKKWAKENEMCSISFDSNYQLNIEDTMEIKENDFVIFVDASMEDIEDFKISKVLSSPKVDFTTHSISPSYLVYLTKELFDVTPTAYLLHIRGYKWGMGEGLSKKAEANLRMAFLFIQNLVKKLVLTKEGQLNLFQASKT